MHPIQARSGCQRGILITVFSVAIFWAFCGLPPFCEFFEPSYLRPERPAAQEQGGGCSVDAPVLVDSDDVLWRAVCEIESCNDPSPVTDPGPADEVGIAQIRPIMVEDVNRILELRGAVQRYTLSDRGSPQRSREMWDVFQDHYNRGQSVEVKARSWNGGPRYDRRAITRRRSAEYWKKIQAVME